MRKPHLLRCLFLLIGVLALGSAALAQVSIGVSVRIGPPALPVYEQPLCPGDGFIWIPGYWAWGPDGYFWVPGTWVIAPRVGFLWTPGYWAWGEDVYIWHPGYWGPHVGFYGGINYGFGYTGVGYAGGYWRGGAFVYNRAVTNVNVTVVHNTYNQTVVNNNVTVNRVSYNGGAGGINARPSREEESAAREQHIAPTSVQTQHEHASASDRALLVSANHGRPPVAATARPGVFSGREVVAAREAPNAREARGGEGATPAAANARREDRPAPRTESPRGNARPTAERADRPAERADRPAERPRSAERPSERPQSVEPRGRPNSAPEPRSNAAPKQNNKPEPREKGGKGEERR